MSAPLPRPRLAPADQRRFEQFYDQHGRAMYALARALTGSAADAEDVVQLSFVDLFRARAAFGLARDPRAYALQVVRRRAVRAHSRTSIESDWPNELDPASAPSEPAATDHDERLERALRALDTATRELIALKVEGELTFDQIGELLGIPAATAATRYRRALESLRERLGGVA